MTPYETLMLQLILQVVHRLDAIAVAVGQGIGSTQADRDELERLEAAARSLVEKYGSDAPG